MRISPVSLGIGLLMPKDALFCVDNQHKKAARAVFQEYPPTFNMIWAPVWLVNRIIPASSCQLYSASGAPREMLLPPALTRAGQDRKGVGALPYPISWYPPMGCLTFWARYWRREDWLGRKLGATLQVQAGANEKR